MNRKYNRSFRQQVMAALLAFGASLLALPAGLAQIQTPPAKSFPDFPLQTGAGNVEPNIMFILDDSGSMNSTEMDNADLGAVRSGTSLNISAQTYTSNTLYYNPAVDYKPWVKADGTRMTGGTSMTAVYSSVDFASGSTTNLWDNNANTRTFYVPKNPANATASYLEDARNYYRYQILRVNGNPTIMRSEYVLGGGWGDYPPSEQEVVRQTGLSRSGTGSSNYAEFTFEVPEGVTELVATTSGGSGNLDLYVARRGSSNNWSQICDDTSGTTTSQSCSASEPSSGTYRVQLRPDSWGQWWNSDTSFSNVTVVVKLVKDYGCSTTSSNSYAWGNCSAVLPNSSRSLDQELQNFATWYSYFRTRMKMAKAGAAEAFSQLGNNVRVGYRSLHQNNNNSNFNIPVGDGNNGVFEGTSRETWFNKLFSAQSNGGTPLRSVLEGVGDYFKSSGANGPYGPQSGDAQLACRQNFAILTTDGYWNSDFGRGGINVGDQDGGNGPSIYNPADGTTSNRYTPASPFRDGSSTGRSNTLADVAMKYWKNDLRSDLENIVPTSSQNPAFWQHMVTFGISIGLKGTVDQTSVADVLRDGSPRINGVDVAWPDPDMTNQSGTAEIPARIDDLLHAAVNSRGEFVAATSADRFRDALVSVLGQIQARLASGSNVATNSTTFQSDTRAFQATYRTGTWTGELTAYSVTAAGGISSTPDWRVSERIASTYANGTSSDDFHRRTVLTWNASSNSGASFPTSAQETLLARSSGAASVTGANNAAYIKGDQSGELSRGGTLRNRTTPLGDIINSSPFYIRDTNTIYVGANDGMLHGIDALTGDVLFSYVPAGIDFAKLATLSDPAYGHAFFVDGPVTVSSYRVKSGTNYLVGTLGRGGRGAFALDVSDVRSSSANQRFTNNHVLWDHTASPDDDMGYVIGLPLIVRGNNDKVLAIVPNGIDSPNGSSALYVYDVADGTLLRKIVADASGGGLSSPRAADLNGDAKVDYVYAGDMNGNVWKFDFTSSNPSSWGIDPDVNGPLFVATDDQGNRQPITGGLALAREPGTGRIWLTFGTGKLITISDLSSTAMQSWYGIIDGDAPIGGRATDLAERTIAATGTNAQGQKVRAFEAYSALPNGKKGWYLDFDRPSEGERVVSGARINGRAAFVSSIIPDVGDGCEAGGSGYLNVIDLFTGTSPQATGGNGSTSFFDLDRSGSGDNDVITGGDGNSLPIGSVDLGVGMPTESSQIDDLVLVCGSDGSCEEAPAPGATGGGKPRRTSWREIYGD